MVVGADLGACVGVLGACRDCAADVATKVILHLGFGFGLFYARAFAG